jgi:hypothetical protein
MAGFGTLTQFEFVHLHLRIERVFGKTLGVKTAVVVAEAKVA